MGLHDTEIGYWAHPAARDKGVTTRAVALVVRHAFIDVEDGGLGFDRVFLKAAASNPSSQRVAQKNGFTEVGRERSKELLGDGKLDDLVVFDLLREEWAAHQH